jgi:hypothetical protein
MMGQIFPTLEGTRETVSNVFMRILILGANNGGIANLSARIRTANRGGQNYYDTPLLDAVPFLRF